jgi:hypothetical protein
VGAYLKEYTMKINEIKTPEDAHAFLVDLVGNRTSREIDKLVGYSGWHSYKTGKCQISVASWFMIWNAVKK